MKYKSNTTKPLYGKNIQNLCFFGNCYYFSCDEKIDGVEKATDEEFEQAVSSIVRSEQTEPEPTPEELAQAEMLLMQSEIIANQNAQDEVLAEILLNQIGG